jgi:glycosyltransferase involved in cell wall biosynthesis
MALFLTTVITQEFPMTQANCAILIPIYNSEKWLDLCIESAVIQDVRCILIWDDGSRDGSLKIAKNWQKKHPNIFIQSAPNRGACIARNALISWALAIGVVWIQFIDADDWLRPNKIKNQLSLWDKKSLWLYCNQVYLDYNYTPPKIIFRKFVNPIGLGYPPHPASWLINTKLFSQYPSIQFDDRFRACRNDLDFWLQALALEVPIQHTDFVGSFYRAGWGKTQLTNVPAWYELDTIQEKFPRWLIDRRSQHVDRMGNLPRNKSYLQARYDCPRLSEKDPRVCIDVQMFSNWEQDKARILQVLETFCSRNIPAHIVVRWPYDHHLFLSDIEVDYLEVTNNPINCEYTIRTGLEDLPLSPIELFNPGIDWEPFGIDFQSATTSKLHDVL